MSLFRNLLSIAVMLGQIKVVELVFVFSQRFAFACAYILYHLILVGRWPSPPPTPNKRLGASRNRPMALAEAKPIFLSKIFEIFRKCPNASERIQMHPNASEWIRTGPNRSEQARKPRKTRENLEKFAKISRKSSRTLVYILR